MKNNYYFPHVATFFFLLTVIVALVSWIGSIYGLGTVQSLLSPEGIRWELRHITSNYVKAPALGIIMILLFGLGIASYSGMVNAIWQDFEKRKAVNAKRKACPTVFCLYFIYLFVDNHHDYFCSLDDIAKYYRLFRKFTFSARHILSYFIRDRFVRSSFWLYFRAFS